MELATQVQILDEVCISYNANAFGKGMNPNTPPISIIGK